jgi:outer membrane protein OmpA-like peptidoglycan-associated protein
MSSPMIRRLVWLPLAVLAAGCASSGPNPAVLLNSYHHYEGEAAALDPGPPASEILQGARELAAHAEKEKGDAARLDLQRAIADARTAGAAAQAAVSAKEADQCLRAVEQSRRNWDDALRILTETEQVARKTSENVPREVPGIDSLAPAALPPTTMSAAAAPMGSGADLSAAWKPWSDAAALQKVPIADLQERFDAEIAASSTGGKAERTTALHQAGRTLQELESRVRAGAGRHTCAAAAELVARLATASDQARQATLELERGLRQDLRTELEKTRQEAADRQNQLYEALQQIQGKYAQITRDARGTIISLADILFDFNKATLKRDVEFSLVRVATILNQFPEMRIAVEGHTDNVGTPEYNQSLSEKRAQSVHDFLVTQGIAAERMTVAGYGMSRPLADNGTEQGRQKNRRVDLVVQD